MEIVQISPSKAYLQGITSGEVADLSKQLGYVRNNIRVMLGKHKQNRWFKQKNLEGWEARLEELKGQLELLLKFSMNLL